MIEVKKFWADDTQDIRMLKVYNKVYVDKVSEGN